MNQITYPGARTFPGWMESTGGDAGATPEAVLPVGFTQYPRDRDLAMRLGGFVWGCRDSAGYQWRLAGIDGLHTVTVDTQTGERAWRDGNWSAPGWVRAKHVAVTCHLVAPPDAGHHGLHERLAAIGQTLPIRRPGPVTVYEYGRAWFFLAQVVGEVDVTRVGAFVYTLKFTLLAPDPVLVAARWESPGPAWTTKTLTATRSASGFTLPVTLPHLIPDSEDGDTRAIFDITGAYPARVVLRIDGPLDRATIVDDAGWHLTVAGRIEAGETLTIDPQARQVTLGGASRRAWIDQWPRLDPGPHAITWTPEGTDASTRLHVDYVETTI